MIRKTRFGPAMQLAESLATKTYQKNTNPEERGRILLGDIKITVTDILIKNEPNLDGKSSTIDDKSSARPESKTVDRKKNSESITDRLGFDRFVSEKDIQAIAGNAAAVMVPIEEKPIESCEVNIKRTKCHWQPCKLLCQKMNVSEPVAG